MNVITHTFIDGLFMDLSGGVPRIIASDTRILSFYSHPEIEVLDLLIHFTWRKP
jgi:hypothetical protein